MKLTEWFKSFGTVMTPVRRSRLTEIDPHAVTDTLATSGALLFRGFDVDMASFEEFSGQFEKEPALHVFLSSIRKQHGETKQIIDVFSGSDVVSLHGEMNFLPRQPAFIWFYCVQPSAEGGETTLCDGIEYLRALPAPVRSMCETRKVVYKPVLPPSGWRDFTKCDAFEDARASVLELPGVRAAERTEEDHMRLEYVASPIKITRFQQVPALVNSILNVTEKRYLDLNLVRCAFEDNSPLPDAFLDELERVGASVSEEVRWRPGDVVLIDNSRMQHGRNPFSGPRTIVTRHSFVH